MKKLMLSFVSMSLVLGACNLNAAEEPVKVVLAALERTEALPREFVYVEETEGFTGTVEGVVEDDLRYQAKFKADGVDVYEQVVSDDALAVRVFDATKIPGFETAAALTGSAVVGDMLASGDWVLDHGAAPPINAPLTSEGTIVIGQNPILDASYFMQYIRRSIDESSGVWKWNKEDLIVYNDFYGGEDGDPFEAVERETGIERYDVLPPRLPARSDRGTENALPGAAAFRKMALYLRDGVVVRVVEFVDIESRIEFVRALEGRAGSSEFHLELMRLALQGKTRDPVRLRRVDYAIRLNEDASVTLPTTSQLITGLEGLFGSQGLSPLPAAPVPTD